MPPKNPGLLRRGLEEPVLMAVSVTLAVPAAQVLDPHGLGEIPQLAIRAHAEDGRRGVHDRRSRLVVALDVDNRVVDGVDDRSVRTSILNISLRRGVGIHLERVDGPVAVGERAGVLGHVVLARTRLGAAGAVGAPGGAGPVAAERVVEHDPVVGEVLVDVAGAAAAGEEGHGLRPARGVGLAAADVAGDVVAGEVPHLDGRGGPFHGVDAAVARVEAAAVRGRVGGVDRAAGGAAGVFVAVARDQLAVEAGAAGGAAVAGVEGDGVGGLTVDEVDVLVGQTLFANDTRTYELIPSRMSISPEFGQFGP